MIKCSVEGCEDAIKHKGMCGKHYKRWWRHGDPTKTLLTMHEGEICVVEGCTNLASIRELCSNCAQRLNRYGRLHNVNSLKGAGTLTASGYIIMSVGGKRVGQHVLVAEKALGKPLPKGAVVHHVNGKPWDNRPENLVVCPNQAYHALLHARMRELGITFE